MLDSFFQFSLLFFSCLFRIFISQVGPSLLKDTHFVIFHFDSQVSLQPQPIAESTESLSNVEDGVAHLLPASVSGSFW